MWYLSFLVKKSICNAWSGMEDVCRVIITVHDPLGHEFSLSNQRNVKVLSEGAPLGQG